MVSHRKMPEEVKRWRKEPKEYLTFKELPAWVRSGIAMVFVSGLTQTEACKRLGKSVSALGSYINKAPGAKEWIEELKGHSEDPKFMAEMAFKSNAHGVSLEYYAAYEKAIAANDYAAVAKMSQDMLDRAGIVRKKEKQDLGGITVQLNLGGGQNLLEPPKIEASYEEIPEEDEDYEIVSEND